MNTWIGTLFKKLECFLILLMVMALSTLLYASSRHVVSKPKALDYTSLGVGPEAYVLPTLDIELFLRKESASSVPLIRIQLFERSKFINIGMYNFYSILLLPSTKKIFFSTFDFSTDKERDGNIETNGIYEFDIPSKKLKRLTPKDNKRVHYYKIVGASKESLQYKEIKVLKDEVETRFKSIHSSENSDYFFRLSQKLENIKKQQLLKLDL